MKRLVLFLVIAVAAASVAQAQTKTPKNAPQKARSVKTLIELTFPAHPYIGVDEQLAGLPGTGEIREEEERIRNVRRELFEEALNVNQRLTPDQKLFVMANYDRLSAGIDRIIDETIERNFPTGKWIREGLRQSYTAKFTSGELAGLIAYFRGTDGQQVLRYIRISEMAQLITGNGGTLDLTEQEKAEHDKFTATPLGKKFFGAFITDAQAYAQRRENQARRIRNADGFAILETINLNNYFNKFVADNYGK
jgi:hypothetical protein